MVATYLRCLLYVKDIERSSLFYTDVLQFQLLQSLPDGYTSFQNGRVVIAVSGAQRSAPSADSTANAREVGVELIMEVTDIDAFYAHVAGSESATAGPLRDQPWGLRDFAITDPDGYRWRVTSIDRDFPHDA